MTNDKDQAYWERNQLVALLSHIFPAHLCFHPADDKEWEPEWRPIVCIHTPAGQACWHIHESELNQFGHLSARPNHWDGHTSEAKYARLQRIVAAPGPMKELVTPLAYQPPLLIALETLPE